MNRQIRVGDSKNVIVFDPLLAGHVILRMRSSRIRIFNGNQREITFIVEPPNITHITHNSRTDRRRVFKLGSNVGHVTRHAQQLFKVKRSKVKVTKSRNVSADKNATTRQCMVISTSNLVGIIDVGSTRVVYFLGQ